jgi:glycosidase
MPQVYSGDEIAMQGREDPDNRRNFPGGFPNTTGATEDAFSPAHRTAQQQDIFTWASMLFEFRKQHPVLQTGEQQNVFVDDTAFAFIRTDDIHKGCSGADHDRRPEAFLIVVNSSDQARQLLINTQLTAAEGCTHLISVLKPALTGNSDPKVDLGVEGTSLHVLVNPHEAGIFQLR